VEYNTSTDPTFDGGDGLVRSASAGVRDTSGRGIHGVFHGTDMKYSSHEKAFEFNGTDDYISVKASGVKGSSFNTSYSLSTWIRMTSSASSSSGSSSQRLAAVFITVGTSATGQMIGFRMNNGSTNYLVYHFGGDSLQTPTSYGISQVWRHVAVTWDNSHQRVYIDGQLAALQTTSSTFLNIPDNPNINIGFRPDGGGSTEYFKGYQSNIKIYDCTLTAQDVRTLYDMDRNGNMVNPPPLHIAAPLYAPGLPVQVVSRVYRGMAAYSSTNADRNIVELNISIKPKFANSRILLHWMLNMEIHQDNVIRVARDGIYILNAFNEIQTTNNWSGIASGAYDQNESTTPSNYCIDTYDEPGRESGGSPAELPSQYQGKLRSGTRTYTYELYIGSSSGTNFPAYINRVYASASNASAHEAGICYMSATEIAQ
jgi:hypothetical protein